MYSRMAFFCCIALLPSSPVAVAKGAIVRVDKEKYLNSVEVRHH